MRCYNANKIRRSKTKHEKRSNSIRNYFERHTNGKAQDGDFYLTDKGI